MFRSPIFMAAACVVAVAGQMAAAQVSLDVTPAELPPPGFAGRQFIDSTGCAFVRADLSGTTAWVPRVIVLDDTRTLLCGFQPTFASAAQAPGGASATPPADAVTSAAPTPPRLAPTPEGDQSPVASSDTADAPPLLSGESLGAPPRQDVVPVPPAQTAPGAPLLAVRSPLELPNQVGDPMPSAATADAPPQPAGPADARVTEVEGPGASPQVGESAVQTATPAPARTARATSTRATTPRATPRAPRGTTLAEACAGRSGIQPGLLSVLTGTPIDCGPGIGSGRIDIAALSPDATRATMAEICDDIRRTGRRYINGRTGAAVGCDGVEIPTAAPAPSAPQALAAATETPPSATVRTGGAAVHRYVQVGAFSQAANAARSAQRLAALGLPSRQGTIRHKGKVLQVVVAGPFDDAGQLNDALATARRGGFADAFTRK